MAVYGNATGGFGMPRTLVLTDDNENEYTGVVTGSVVVFDATPADVKIGKIFAGTDGIQKGSDTKTYRTTYASRLVLPGEAFSIPLEEYDQYDYTKFQAMIAKFNITEYDSISISKISIHDCVYDVNSSNKLSNVTKNTASKSIDLNITNDTGNVYIIHYSTYKEE